jgi:hypothetical protein
VLLISKIKCEEHVKLLGVTIDYELNFDKHILEICKKSARQLNVLKIIGRYLNKLGRLTIYYSFILSNFLMGNFFENSVKILKLFVRVGR